MRRIHYIFREWCTIVRVTGVNIVDRCCHITFSDTCCYYNLFFEVISMFAGKIDNEICAQRDSKYFDNIKKNRKFADTCCYC